MASGIETKLEEIEESYEQAAAELTAPHIAADPDRLRDLGKRFAELQDVVVPYREYKAVSTQAREARDLAKGEADPEMAAYFHDEAALWAADLFEMYQRLADRHRWKTDVLASSLSDLGGFKEVSLEVRGPDAYGRLKYEAGVHRVQRVPVTESPGRMHTSP